MAHEKVILRSKKVKYKIFLVFGILGVISSSDILILNILELF